MNRNTYIQLLSASILLGISVFLLNPLHFWMPDMAHLAILGCLLAAFAVLSVFLLQEEATDEREEAHRMLAGRVAFFVGSLVLVIGISIESMHSAPDMWLVLALAGMVIAKIAARLYSSWRL